ncbi:MAG: hypothetical protein KF864_03605 [Phycisphaeraceae bacterium]|nr:hypothetical protein [Phycisphaeraceae bacterium]
MPTTPSDAATFRFDLAPSVRGHVATWPGDPAESIAWRWAGAGLRAGACVWNACRALAADVLPLSPPTRADWRLMEWMSRRGWPTRELRVGVVEPGDWCAPFTEARGPGDVSWFAVSRDVAVNRALNKADLDALVRRDEDGGVTVHTREHAGKESAWYDWAGEPPLSYPAVFPTRLDCTRVSLGECGVADGGAVRLLIELAAALSRSPARLTPADVARGRSPVGAAWAAAPVRGISAMRTPGDPVRPLMRALLGMVDAGALSAGPARAASRVCGAWLATDETGVGEHERAHGARSVVRCGGHEPQTMLRAAAAMLGSLHDGEGIDHILRADRMMRRVDLLPCIDHAAFLNAELMHAAATPLAVGRIAAGICLVGASLPVERLHYFLDDLAEDLRFATLLLGRDQDLLLLRRVVHELERARRAEVYVLPAPAAAQTATAQAGLTPASPGKTLRPTARRAAAPRQSAPRATKPRKATQESAGKAGTIGPAKPGERRQKKAA